MHRISGCPRRLLLFAPVVFGLALATASCGGSPGSGVASLGSTTTTVATSSGTGGGGSSDGGQAGALVKFARCMRAHGVADFPVPTSSGGTIKVTKQKLVSTPHFLVASRVCAKYAPPQRTPPPLTPQDRTDYLRAAACMRAHGVVGFPDPIFSGSQVRFPIPKTMNPDSPQFLRARETCETLIPAGLPYSKEDENGQ
jgi:hypothetical protein